MEKPYLEYNFNQNKDLYSILCMYICLLVVYFMCNMHLDVYCAPSTHGAFHYYLEVRFSKFMDNHIIKNAS